MPTTTNYGWTTPADTDLVKDGAAAIRTLGSSIDTTVFNNASAGIAKTIVDAKGDLIAATASDTVARLPIGATNGQVLTVDSAEATGMKWATASSGGMTLLSTTSLTGTSVTISSISQGYTDLQVILAGITFASNTNIYVRWNNDSSNSITTGYSAYSGGSFRTTDGQLASTGVTSHHAALYMPNYASSTYKKPGWGNEVMANYGLPLGLLYDATTAITSITIATSGNSFTAGTCLIYGVK
jgi:hypothetical protein